MKIIVITSPELVAEEREKITAALEMGIWRLHIRKPGYSEAQLAELIESLPQKYYGAITLHDHLDLAVKYRLGGVQLNARNGVVPDGFDGLVSHSAHSLAELAGDYSTLSPIYDSISKEGYSSRFRVDQLEGVNERVIAMGGVTPDKLLSLFEMGFGGAALLGYLWQAEGVEEFKARVALALKAAQRCEHFALQYITHRTEERGDLEGAEAALKGGCRWVQLRMKDASDSEIIAAGRALRELCDRYSATMLLDDRVDLVRELGADGVHLGKNDMPPDEARGILGAAYIIGGTANTIEDMDRLFAQGVDYIGMGPFRYTTTKQGLSPIIGLEGYISAKAHAAKMGYATPIVAIGGIEVADVKEIISTGVRGIALSGTILRSQDPILTTASVIKEIKR
ncbi:MAG: thiamine phosphate synthase [Rikenellaceae bacterium]